MKYLLAIIILALVVFAALMPVSLDVVTPKPAPTPSATIIFGGDMMFDRYVRSIADRVGGDYLFSCIDPVIRAADLAVANLEGPITDRPSRGGADLIFTFPPETAPLLARHNIAMVNIGNNHILNFGVDGLDSTRTYLDAAGVRWFGDSSIATTTVQGIPLAFINYNQFGASFEYASVLQNTSIARDGGYIPIVYTHWGEEYEQATAMEKDLAHRLIDGGAEIVIGSHPHVVQEHEMYQGNHIYYSLGNFIFDQYFSDVVMHSLLIKAHFSPTGVTGVEEIPIVLTSDGRVCRI